MTTDEYAKLPLRDRMAGHLLTRTYTSKKVHKLYPEANWDKWSKEGLEWAYKVVDELKVMLDD